MELTDDELDIITGGGKPGECPDSPTGYHEPEILKTSNGDFGSTVCKHCKQKL